ncbi:MAG: transporter substrate-binding domain-containing protein [Pseudomonadales bacterium]|nr:transporter substrate-binding domain-containing protein [Pseudomonadales bacterium]
MVNRWNLITLGLLIVQFFVVRCASAEDLNIIHFATGEYPPFVSEQLPDNGPSTIIIREACRRAGLKAEFDFFPWARAAYEVKIGDYVATYQWVKTPEREKDFLFSALHISENPNAVFYRKSQYPDGITFNRFADLQNYNLIGVIGYWYEKEFERLKINVHYVSQSQLAWQLLSRDRPELYVDNLYTGITEGKRYIPDWTNQIAYQSPDSLTEYGYIMYSRRHPEAAEQKKRIDAALASMHQDGTYQKMWQSFPLELLNR